MGGGERDRADRMPECVSEWKEEFQRHYYIS